MKELENELESERKVSGLLEEEINRLKSNVSNEQLKVDSYNSQLKQLDDDLNVQIAEVQKKLEIIKNLEKNVEEKNVRIENLSLELEEITKEKYRNEEKFRSKEEKLCRQVIQSKCVFFFFLSK